MGVRESGLTLEGLANRLEALERENEQMRSENVELRHKVTVLEGSDTRRDRLAEIKNSDKRVDGEPASVLEGRVSRRSLLSKAGAAAVAAAAAGTLLNTRQAKAHVTTTDVHADEVFAHALWAESHNLWTPIVSKASNNTEAIRGSNENTGSGVKGYSRSGSGVVGITDAGRFTGDPPATDQAGVKGDGPTGVLGHSSNDSQAAVKGVGVTGVWGLSSRTGYSGVYGEHTGFSGHGTVGIGKGEAHAGVLGRNSDGTGVHGQSSKTGYGAITAEHTGTSGYGVIGLGTGPSAGVLGRNSTGEGVRGEGSTSAEVAGVRGLGKRGVWGSSSTTSSSGVYGQHTGTSGDGVVGEGKGVGAGVLGRNNSGYGGRFEGGRAQLMIKPGVITGAPTSGAHSKGEIYMDSAGTLFVCVASNTATAAATWKKLSATAV